MLEFDSAETARRIEELLRAQLAPTELEVEDQTYQHYGHSGRGAGGHFAVTVRSAKFTGLSPIARQRLVLELVKPMMDREIHALSMRCLAP